MRIVYDQHGLSSLSPINMALATRAEAGEWMMSPAEKIVLLFLLYQLRPQIAIEIGTYEGGSLRALSAYCKRVYSIDPNSNLESQLGEKFTNVDFVTGKSDDVLPGLLKKLYGAPLSFVLVDGDMFNRRQDLEMLLTFNYTVPTVILIHDSFNPTYRRGILAVNWDSYPQVHAVDLDFVVGNDAPDDEVLWGGFTLVVVNPWHRMGALRVTAAAGRILERFSDVEVLPK